MTPILGHVKGGKFTPDSSKEFRQAFVRHEGRRVVVSVKRWQPKRSTKANAYYHAVVVPFWMEAQGTNDHITMHEILRLLYNYKAVQVGAEVVRLGLKTRDLDAEKFGAFVDRCVMGFAEEFGGEIPPPNSAVSLEMIEQYQALGNSEERSE